MPRCVWHACGMLTPSSRNHVTHAPSHPRLSTQQARVLKEEGNCHFKNEQLRSATRPRAAALVPRCRRAIASSTSAAGSARLYSLAHTRLPLWCGPALPRRQRCPDAGTWPQPWQATSKYRAATRKLARFSLRRLPFGCDEMVQLLVSCHLNMALCMLKLGEASKAVANCDRVLELDPVNTKVRANCGRRAYRGAALRLTATANTPGQLQGRQGSCGAEKLERCACHAQ